MTRMDPTRNNSRITPQLRNRFNPDGIPITLPLTNHWARCNIISNTNCSINFSWICKSLHYRGHLQRFTPVRQVNEIKLLKQTFAQTSTNLELMKSQLHQATSSAPETDEIFEEAQRTPFTNRIANIFVPDFKQRIHCYEGNSDHVAHVTTFCTALGHTYFSDGKWDARYSDSLPRSLQERLWTGSLD